MVASDNELKYVNKISKHEVDIHEGFGVEQHRRLIYDAEDKSYYIVSNRYEEKLGFYVLKLSE